MIRRLTSTAIALAVFGLATAARGQDDAATKALDGKVHASVFKTIDTGYKLFNDGDQAGCYRIYQGALVALAQILDYRPDLKEIADKALADSDTHRDYAGRAFALRRGLDLIYKATANGTVPAKPLWTRLGGEPAVKAVVHEFVGIAAADPKVDFTRGGKYKIDAQGVENLEKLLVQLVSATTGGPLKYEGRDMKVVHQGMGITEDQFNALAADLIGVLDKFQVPKKEKDELVAIVASTKSAMVEGARPAPPEPMPDKPGDKPKPPPEPMPDKPAAKPLWDRLGGTDAVKAVVHDFVGKTAANPKVDFTRGGKYKIDAKGVENLEKLLVEFVSSATGGPLKYTGRDMTEVHKGMMITDEQFGAMAEDLVAVLKDYAVPQKEIDELIGIVGTTKKAMVEDK